MHCTVLLTIFGLSKISIETASLRCIARLCYPEVGGSSPSIHCKCFDHKDYRDWKLQGTCRENMHYLWKRAVRIAGPLQFPVPVVFMVKTFAVHEDSFHSSKGTIHLRRRQIFTIFDPYPPYHRHSSKMLMKGIFDPYVL